MLKSFVLNPPIRLLAIDIDGTLLNPQFEISPVDMAALRRVHQEGVEVLLVTGRRHTFALPIAQQLGFDLWLISSNGAITRSLGGETFHRDLLPAATCLIDFVIPIEKSITRDPVQAMFCGPIARMHQALDSLASGSVSNHVTVLRTEYPVRDLSIVDVLNQGCSKGHALERWASYRNIPRGQVMAIGDNYNDIEMLAFAGLPFIMGNASDELRDHGWAVTRSNAEHGVAHAIEQVMGSVKVG